MKIVGVAVPEELLSKIDEIARRERNPRSAVVRRILAEALEKFENGGAYDDKFNSDI
ncbi:ribbon-helix-helix protein, CopG family [Archaeoglobus sp.]